MECNWKREYIDAYSIDNWTLETCTDLAAVASDAPDELMTAPIEPNQSAILRGVAAVFFHEILGHRIEGHNKKMRMRPNLTDKVGQSIFPEFITVIDDLCTDLTVSISTDTIE